MPRLGHNSATHSPVLRTWDMRRSIRPTRDSLFRFAELTPRVPACRLLVRTQGRATGVARVTFPASSDLVQLLKHRRDFAPLRRLDTALRLCSAGRSTGLNARQVFAVAHTGPTPLGRRATLWGSAERSAPHTALSLGAGPPYAAFGGRSTTSPCYPALVLPPYLG